MKMISNGPPRSRPLGPVVSLAAFAVALSLQACGGAGPDGGNGPTGGGQPEQTGRSTQGLDIFGIPIPEPKVTVSVNDASATINPLAVIDELLPPQGIRIDPIKPVDQIIGDLQKPIGIGATGGGVSVGVELPGLPVPTIPDPFPDGGLLIIGP